MADVENVEDMVGIRAAQAAAVATESGGAATTSDETVATAGDETAATGGYVCSNVRSGRPIVDSPSLRLKGHNEHTLQPIPGTNSKGKD